jgi:hypothetical protein
VPANIDTSQESNERHTAIIKKKGRERHGTRQGPGGSPAVAAEIDHVLEGGANRSGLSPSPRNW